jgi:hypothetical protein
VDQRLSVRDSVVRLLGTWFLQRSRCEGSGRAARAGKKSTLDATASRLAEPHFGKPLEWGSLATLIMPLCWNQTHWALVKLDVSPGTPNKSRVAELWDGNSGAWITLTHFKVVVAGVNNVFSTAHTNGDIDRLIKFKVPTRRSLKQLPTQQNDGHSCSVLALSAAEEIAKSNGGNQPHRQGGRQQVPLHNSP